MDIHNGVFYSVTEGVIFRAVLELEVVPELSQI